jgi:hypothetical protein
MTFQNHLYKLNLPLASASFAMDESSPIVRIWSCQSISHPAFIPCKSSACTHVHLWFFLFDQTQTSEQERANAWLSQCADAVLVLVFSDASDRHLQAIQDVVFALQCDWAHSAMANADLEDLVETLGKQELGPHAKFANVRMGSALSTRASDYTEGLNKAWIQVFRGECRQMLLVRAHAPHDFTLKSDAFAEWRRTMAQDLNLIYWDVYDLGLQAGQKRFTFLTAD